MKIRIITDIEVDDKKAECKEQKGGRSIMCQKLNELSGKTAANILELCPTNSNTYAIDMKEIMKKIGVSVVTYDFTELGSKIKKNINGAIVLSGDRLAVFISKKLSQEEQRWVLAHELGHCCRHASTLKNQRIEFACDLYSLDSHEQEADSFAYELLLPEKDFRKVCDKFSGTKDIGLLSEIFCVPAKCITHRIAELNIT